MTLRADYFVFLLLCYQLQIMCKALLKPVHTIFFLQTDSNSVTDSFLMFEGKRFKIYTQTKGSYSAITTNALIYVTLTYMVYIYICMYTMIFCNSLL